MKRLLSIAMIICLPGHKAVSQRTCSDIPLLHYIGDTLAYVKTNFIDQKDRYVGKPFTVLLKDMQIPVGSYLIAPGWSDYKHFKQLIFSFYPAGEMSSRITNDKKPLIICIEFERKLLQDSAMVLRKQGHGAWRPEEERFYGRSILKDIVLTDYSRHRPHMPLLRVDTTGYVYHDLGPSFVMQGKADAGVGGPVAYPADIDAFLEGLHNDAAKFKLVLVMDKVIYTDGGGKPSGNLLQPVSLNMSTVKKNYPAVLLISKLVQRLGDDERDYYADLLLYSLIGVGCGDFQSWSTREKWLSRNPDNTLSHKKTDLQMWRGALDLLYWGIECGSNF